MGRRGRIVSFITMLVLETTSIFKRVQGPRDMGKDLRDTSKRVATLCKSREFAPVTGDMIEAQQECGFWEKRTGNWCLHYRAGGQCSYVVLPEKPTTVEKTED
jgi:hypothetical protein